MDIGSVEGLLVRGMHGIAVIDALTGREVPIRSLGRLPSTEWEDAIGKRVAVLGEVFYHDGKPMLIDIESLHVFPPEEASLRTKEEA